LKSETAKPVTDKPAGRPVFAVLYELVGSPLAFSLLSAFMALAVFEVVLIGLLCQDVLSADRSARQELQLLRLTEEVSTALESGKAIRSASKRAFARPEDPSWRTAYASAHTDLHKRLLDLSESYRKAGLDPAFMNPSLASLSQLDNLIRKFAPGSKRSLAEWKTYGQTWVQVFKANLNDLRHLHKLITSGRARPPVFNCTPAQMLIAGAAANALFLVLILLFVSRRITQPIVALTSDCLRIGNAELMDKPSRVSDEINQLQQSFYEMSVLIADNEKSRRNFLEILQSVQIATLEKVRAQIEPVAALESLAPKAAQRCRTIIETLSGLVQLLNWLTEALRAGSTEKIMPQHAPCQSGRLVETASAAVESLLINRKISLATEIDSEGLECDEQLIGRVLVNLLSNAIKFSKDGARVVVSCRRSGNLLRFAVQDSGPGISAEDSKKLFKRFSQLASPDGVRRRGHGLGLSICKQIVEAHGGRIGCESEVGKGSTFWFLLPLNKTEAAVLPAEIESESGQSAGWGTGRASRRFVSIKSGFAILLVAFISVQSLLAGMLCAAFNETSARAANYARKKEVMLDVQEYLVLFLVWAYKMDLLRDKMEFESREFCAADISSIMDLMPPAKERMRMAERVIKLSPGSYVAAMMREILARDRVVLQLVREGIRSASGDPATLLQYGNKVSDMMELTDRDIFKTIVFQKEDIEAAYVSSAILRWQILVALTAAAILDFLLLAAITGLGLGIIHRVANLQAKAADLSAGALLSRSLPGNDELSCLDESICKVSASIKEAEARRQNLLSVISHDLATPLSSVLTGVGMLSQGLYQSMSERELLLLRTSERDLKKLLQQTYDLLMIEKIDSGTLSPRKDRHDLRKILAGCLDRFRKQAEERQVNLLADFDQLQEARVVADPQLLERLIEILLENALQASPPASSLDAGALRDPERITVYIKDSGPGINEALRVQLFERFRFLDGKPITGLGLPLAHRLAKLSGVELKILACPEGGTRVDLHLYQNH
jgi:signal transduction histidine kinase